MLREFISTVGSWLEEMDKGDHMLILDNKTITITRVDNGFTIDGSKGHVSTRLIANSLDEVIECLWRSFSRWVVGEKCPYLQTDGVLLAKEGIYPCHGCKFAGFLECGDGSTMRICTNASFEKPNAGEICPNYQKRER